MKKKYLVLAVAAMFTLAAATSCGDSKKSKKDKDDTEAVDEEEKDDEDDGEADDYYTQDLATFDLRGQVIGVKYIGDEHTVPVYVLFGEEGFLKSVTKIDVEGVAEEAGVERDRKNRINRLAFPSDDPWVSNFDYDSDTMLPTEYTNENQMGNFTTEKFERDDDGTITEATFTEGVHGNIVSEDEPFDIKFSNLDGHGNWQRCDVTIQGYTVTYKRLIIYKGEENVLEQEIAKAREVDPAIKDFIVDMYENQRYNDEPFIKAHCTDRMLDFLKANYDYDGEGYAVWMFRTSGQDGKPGAEGQPDKVLSVTKDAEGWYHYQFTDGGWRGENRIKVFNENGKIVVDRLERVYDECAEANN